MKIEIKNHLKRDKIFSAFLIVVFFLLLTISISAFNLLPIKTASNIISVLSISGIIILLILIIREIFRDFENFKVSMIVGSAIIAIIIMLGRGTIQLVQGFFPKNTTEMIGFYGNIIGSLISALIGVFGALFGAKLGGEKSYKAAMDSVTAQIKYQNELLDKERKNKEQLAVKIIAKFLWYEIDYNCETLDGNNKIFSTNRFLKNRPEQLSYERVFKFDDYSKIKYQLLNYNSETVNKVIDLYNKLFILKNHNDLDQLTQKEFEEVKTLYKVKNQIYEFIKNNN